MHNPGFFMKLADHLFSVQMARYRSKYSLITFPSDATYIPPALPAHVSVNLDPVSGAPSDEEIVKVQDAVRAYQHFSSVPSMFDPYVNMELSQHLFDIQMARYMRLAGEAPRSPEPQATIQLENPTQSIGGPPHVTEATNNAGTIHSAVPADRAAHSALGINPCKLIERSNQLAERLSQLK